MMINLRSALLVGLVWPWCAFAGARIDLRPTPPMPPDRYAPNTRLSVAVYLVDTGNEQGDIAFRGLSLDFSATTPGFTYPGDDGVAGTADDYFAWQIEGGVDTCAPGECWPRTSWIYPLPVPSPTQPVLPDGGELLLGHVVVQLGSQGGVLDVMNASDSDPNHGATGWFGFGGDGDPVTTWRAISGELTGGRLEIAVNDGSVRSLIGSDPPDGAIDARQPSDMAGQIAYGWQSVELTFDGGMAELSPVDLFISETGGDGVAPVIVSIDMLAADRARVTLSEPIEPGTWTRFLHTASGSSIRLGYLPGDVNGDGAAAAKDILALIDSLNGANPRPDYAADANRSGLSEPADILRVIDLLNGAGAFDAWNGVSLP